MRELKASHLSTAGKTFHAKERDIAIEEKRCDINIKKQLVKFYICREVACFLCLLVMLILVLTGLVNGEIFLVSQVINAIFRGRGKGLRRITESEFPKRDVLENESH